MWPSTSRMSCPTSSPPASWAAPLSYNKKYNNITFSIVIVEIKILFKKFLIPRTWILMILGSGCLVLAPPSIAIPSIDFVFFTVILRFPWWSGTTRAPSSSRLSDISLLASLWALWCRLGGPPVPAVPVAPLPEPPSSSNWASCMSKLRDSLCASS